MGSLIGKDIRFGRKGEPDALVKGAGAFQCTPTPSHHGLRTVL